ERLTEIRILENNRGRSYRKQSRIIVLIGIEVKMAFLIFIFVNRDRTYIIQIQQILLAFRQIQPQFPIYSSKRFFIHPLPEKHPSRIARIDTKYGKYEGYHSPQYHNSVNELAQYVSYHTGLFHVFVLNACKIRH